MFVSAPTHKIDGGMYFLIVWYGFVSLDLLVLGGLDCSIANEFFKKRRCDNHIFDTIIRHHQKNH